MVRPIEPGQRRLSRVCIQENPYVQVPELVPLIREVLSRRGIRSEVFARTRGVPDHCEVILTYTAYRSWDFSAYLAHAEVWLERDGLQIGYAEYHLRGDGGFSLYKWQSTRTKMEPVLEELLSQTGP